MQDSSDDYTEKRRERRGARRGDVENEWGAYGIEVFQTLLACLLRVVGALDAAVGNVRRRREKVHVVNLPRLGV
jgi:hypothetical protein